MKHIGKVLCSVLLVASVAHAQRGGGPPADAGPKLAAPTIHPEPGTYIRSVKATLLAGDPDAELHYTLDGSVPTANSATFNPRLLLPISAPYDGDRGTRAGFTIRAIATKPGFTASDPVTFVYTIERPDRTAYLSDAVMPGVRMVRDSDNGKMFLVVGTTGAALIDSGQGRGALRDYLTQFIGARPLTVILTHNHGDHVGQADQFIATSPVYIGEPDRAAVVRRFQTAGIPDATIDANLKVATDGMRVDLGDRSLTVMLMPGHTPGSLVVFDETSGALFTGDSFGSNNALTPDSAWLHFPTSSPMDVYMGALRSVRGRVAGKVTAVLTGHNDRARMGEGYLDNVELAAQRVIDRGADTLVPALQPANGWWSLVGDRLTDPNWVALSVNRDRLLSAPSPKLSTLSTLQVEGAVLEAPFSPDRKAYRALAQTGVRAIRVTPRTMASNARVTAAGGDVARGTAATIPLRTATTVVPLVVTSADGTTSTTYEIAVTRQ